MTLLRSRARLAAAGLFLAALAFACACAVNPATGRRELSLVSADQELAIGQEGYPATIAEYGLYDDKRLAAYVDSIGHRLAKVSELPNLDWHFTVLDDPVVNAFAMPGGYIYITRGILAHLNSEAQLAGVLGHEIGHVTARHSAKHITQQQIAGLGLGLAGALSETFARYSGAAEQGLGLLMLKYSRDDESQADALGIRYATAAGWDPRQIPSTYAMLKRIGERAGSGLPFYLSTHPDPGDREARTTALAAQAVAGKTALQVHRREFLARTRGIVYGDDPQQGYFEDNRYYQPAMGLELAFPPGWATQNGHSAVIAQEPQKAAALQMTAASNAGALAPDEYVAALRRDGRIAAADGAAESIGGWGAWVGRITIPGANGAAPTVLLAAWVRTSGTQMLQFVGQSAGVGDANTSRMLESIRSLRRLSDPKRANATPQRLRIQPAPVAGTLQSLLGRFGANAVSADDAAILNGLELTDTVPAGEWVKTVEPGQKR